MTVLSEESRKEYVGNGTLDTYVYTWQIYTKDDNKVYVAGVLKTVDIHYTVTGVLNPGGGNIIFTAGNIPANLASIVIYLDLLLIQAIDYKEGDKFPAETHERGLDRLTKIVQQFRQVLNRIIKVPISSLLTNLQVPEGAGKLWGWNALGTAPALYNQIIDTGVITTKGDLVVGSATGVAERKPIGTESQIPEVESGILAYKDPSHFKLDDWGVPDDNTDLNATPSLHGLMSKTDKTKLDAIKRKIVFPAAVFETRVLAAWAAFVQTQGTNFDFGELDFDAASDEKVISPPFRFTNWNAGNITVRIGWKANATTGNVIWVVSFLGRDTTTPEVFDAAPTDHNLTGSTTPGTVEYLKETVWTGAVSELANNDIVIMKITRNADDGGDTLAVDAKLLYVEIEYTEV